MKGCGELLSKRVAALQIEQFVTGYENSHKVEDIYLFLKNKGFVKIEEHGPSLDAIYINKNFLHLKDSLDLSVLK